MAAALALATARLPAAEVNRPAELRFTAARTHADPFNDVTLDAVVTAPDGSVARVPAFWSGGASWRVRYASRLPGTHRYRTECSDPADAGLHGVSGEIVVTPYTGNNPLFRHGPVRVAADRRHFAHEDGTPFFWLGDTWWMGLTRRLHWPDDFQRLAADRREKGFTVVQIVAGLYPDMPAFDERGLGDGGFPWEPDYARIRPEYFDAADRRIEHLVEQGLMPCIVGCWGYHLPWLGTQRIKQHWRYLIARWGAWPVVWCASGEQAMAWYNSTNKAAETEQLRREWTAVIRSLRETDPYHRLVTTHPRQQARDEVLDPAVLDFDMQQSGHGSPAPQHAAKALTGWGRAPVMPVISGESRYEALEINPTLGAREARQAFWAHLLNCGTAGHTYGANGIWQVNRTDQRYGKSPGGNDWGGTPWDQAMRLPGSTQLAHAKRFLLGRPWHRLAPSTNLCSGATAAAATSDATCFLALSLGGAAVRVDLGRFPRQLQAQWLDPADGTLRAIDGSPFPNTGQRAFATPGPNAAGDDDWLLVLEAAATLATHWPQFRGPIGQGHSPDPNPPLTWSSTENVAWKTPVPGESWSSPIVWGNHVFVTTATDSGETCRVLALNRESGAILWDRPVFQQVPRRKEGRNSYATPTPATDGERVYACFADGSLAALTFAGELVWTNRHFPFFGQHGLATSPLLWRNLLIMARDGSSDGEDKTLGWQKPWDQACILAIDTATGEARWQAKRGLSRISHGMPALWEHDGTVQVVSEAGDVVQGFDVHTGSRLWSSDVVGEGKVPSTVLGGGLVFTAGGWGGRESIKAFKLGGQGELKETNLAWEQKKGMPKVPSMLHLDPHLFAVTDGGIATCLDARTGQIVWQERLGGNFSASPVAAAGRLYFTADSGETTVIEAGPAFRILARNPLGEKVQASMAIAQGQLFLRTEQRLFCIGRSQPGS